MDLQVGGVSKASIRKDGAIAGLGAATFGSETAGVVLSAGLTLYNNGYLGWASSGSSLGTIDTKLYRDAANTLALRNGTAAQKFSVYNTYTDASNYERGVFDWAGTANTLRIGTEAAGTGTVRNIQLVAGSNSVTMTPGASNLLTLNGGLTTGGAVTLPATQYVGFNTRSSIEAPATGNILLADWAGTSFNLLQFGGTTSSFPALRRSTTNLEVRLADDSAYAPFTAGNITAAGSTVFATNMLATGYIKTTATTVGALGSASTAGAGARSFVTDANATMAAGIGTAVVGGGANKVPVYSDGTNWLIG